MEDISPGHIAEVRGTDAHCWPPASIVNMDFPGGGEAKSGDVLGFIPHSAVEQLL